jgi:hypothetical protein
MKTIGKYYIVTVGKGIWEGDSPPFIMSGVIDTEEAAWKLMEDFSNRLKEFDFYLYNLDSFPAAPIGKILAEKQIAREGIK